MVYLRALWYRPPARFSVCFTPNLGVLTPLWGSQRLRDGVGLAEPNGAAAFCLKEEKKLQKSQFPSYLAQFPWVPSRGGRRAVPPRARAALSCGSLPLSLLFLSRVMPFGVISLRFGYTPASRRLPASSGSASPRQPCAEGGGDPSRSLSGGPLSPCPPASSNSTVGDGGRGDPRPLLAEPGGGRNFPRALPQPLGPSSLREPPERDGGCRRDLGPFELGLLPSPRWKSPRPAASPAPEWKAAAGADPLLMKKGGFILF